MISLPEKEYRMIDAWRRDHVCNANHDFISSETLLTPWEEAKSQYLYNLFGKNLILRRKGVVFKKDEDTMIKELSYNPLFNEFLNSLERYIAGKINRPFWNWPCGLSTILRHRAIIQNRYQGHSIDLMDTLGIKINHGEKIMRIFRKILENDDVPQSLKDQFEDFRIGVSKITNNNAESGTLCLSIHPLDYMTMSDNNYDWDTCMNWDDGCYRLGTTTMLNSPCVVMGYIQGDKDFLVEDTPWSNKKWRCLFIITPDVIASIKDYPYHNDELRKIFVNWLRDLAKENLGWEYDEHMFHRPTDSYDIFDEENRLANLQYNFLTEIMYNDFGTHITHYFYFNKTLLKYYYNPEEKHTIYCELDYCGPWQCMSCGEIDFEWHKESTLECLECGDMQPYTYCECCGQAIWDEDDDNYWYDEYSGCYYCDECHSNLFSRCEFDDEFILNTMIKDSPVFVVSESDVNINEINHTAFINNPKETKIQRLCCCPTCFEGLKEKNILWPTLRGVNVFNDGNDTLFLLQKEIEASTRRKWYLWNTIPIVDVDYDCPDSAIQEEPLKLTYHTTH